MKFIIRKYVSAGDIRSRRTKLVGNIWEIRSTYRILITNPEWKRPLGRFRHR
jgi:hypothetical protein